MHSPTSPSLSTSPTVTILLPFESQLILFLILNLTCPVVSSIPKFLYHETALSFEEAVTRSSRPSESKSAETAERAPIASIVTIVRESGVNNGGVVDGDVVLLLLVSDSLFVWAEIIGKRVEDRQHNCRSDFFLAAVNDDDFGCFIFALLIFSACLL